MIVALALAALAAAEDLRERTISNEKCIALAALGIAFQLARALAPQALAALPWEGALSARRAAPWACILSAGITLIFLGGAELAVRRLRERAGLGFGDIKYLAAWAIILGPLVAVALALACAGGATFALARRERDFAFAPWIGLGCAVVLAIIPFA